MPAAPQLAVLPATDDDLGRAAALATQLELPCLAVGVRPRDRGAEEVLLTVVGDQLSLQRGGIRAPGPVRVDFGDAGMRYRRRSGHNELLGKAVGAVRKPGLQVLDATAGLGRDAFVLADLGCEVTLCEREPVVVALLAAGIQQAALSGDSWLQQIVQRMRLVPGDCRELESGQIAGVEVIYLDPMFGARRKSAAVGKEMALFQTLFDVPEAAAADEDFLIWAEHFDVARIVVKRGKDVPPMGNREPSHSLNGRAVRYDVYVKRALE